MCLDEQNILFSIVLLKEGEINISGIKMIFRITQ